MGVSPPGTPPSRVSGVIKGVKLTPKAGFNSMTSVGDSINCAVFVGERAGLHSGHKKLYGGRDK